MSELTDSIHIDAPLARTWDYYFEPRGWAAWVDGFGSVESADRYPDAGGTLTWVSTPAGRGRVTERVLEHEPRTAHRISFADPESSGELTTRFEVDGEGTRVTLELSYRLEQGGFFSWISDRFFVRGQLAGSLRRTLQRLRLEVEELEELAERPPTG